MSGRINISITVSQAHWLADDTKWCGGDSSDDDEERIAVPIRRAAQRALDRRRRAKARRERDE